MIDACTAQYPSERKSRVDCIWRPQQTLEDHRLIRTHKIAAPGLRKHCRTAYALILAADPSELPLAEEGEILAPFRTMMRRVAATLCGREWTELPADDAFVVVALDSIGYWLKDDLKAGIPSARRKILKQRGLLTA